MRQGNVLLRKRKDAIAPSDVASIFDVGCIQELARIARLPLGADLDRFGDGVRKAAVAFATKAAKITTNDLHTEIDELYRMARSNAFEKVADLIESLSPEAVALLNNRGKQPGSPQPTTIESPQATLRALSCSPPNTSPGRSPQEFGRTDLRANL